MSFNISDYFHDNYTNGYRKEEKAKGFFSSLKGTGRIHLLKDYGSAESGLLDQFAIAAKKLEKNEPQKLSDLEEIFKTHIIVKNEDGTAFKINKSSLIKRLNSGKVHEKYFNHCIANQDGFIKKDDLDLMMKLKLEDVAKAEIEQHVKTIDKFSKNGDRDGLIKYLNQEIPDESTW